MPRHTRTTASRKRKTAMESERDSWQGGIHSLKLINRGEQLLRLNWSTGATRNLVPNSG